MKKAATVDTIKSSSSANERISSAAVPTTVNPWVSSSAATWVLGHQPSQSRGGQDYRPPDLMAKLQVLISAQKKLEQVGFNFIQMHLAHAQGGINCEAINEPRKSSKAIDKLVIINFRDKNVIIARFRDKNEVFVLFVIYIYIYIY